MIFEWASGLTIQCRKIQMENIQLDNGDKLKSLELNQQCKYFEEGLIWRRSDHQQKNHQISIQKWIF